MNFNQTAQGALMPSTLINNDTLDRLRSKLFHLQAELNKTQEAIEALEKNPDLLKVLNAIQGGIY